MTERSCPKHVEVYSKIKFVHHVGFIIKRSAYIFSLLTHSSVYKRFLHLLLRFRLYCYLLLTFHRIFLFVHPNIILPLFLPSSPLCFRQIFFKTRGSWKTTMKNIRHDMYFSASCQCLPSVRVRKWHNVPLTFLYQGYCMTVASPLPLLAKKKSVYTSIKHISQGAHTPFYMNVQRRWMPF
jgi:hypothetical protein